MFNGNVRRLDRYRDGSGTGKFAHLRRIADQTWLAVINWTGTFILRAEFNGTSPLRAPLSSSVTGVGENDVIPVRCGNRSNKE